MTLASFQWAAALLWSCDTGTDLMVTYQRPLSSAPPTLWGPIQSFTTQAANTGLDTACCTYGTQSLPHTPTYRRD